MYYIINITRKSEKHIKITCKHNNVNVFFLKFYKNLIILNHYIIMKIDMINLYWGGLKLGVNRCPSFYFDYCKKVEGN